MQVNYGPFDIDKNIHQGVALLREYYLMMKGNVKATVLSYNMGPARYLRGNYRKDLIEYFHKFDKQRKEYGKWLSLEYTKTVPAIDNSVGNTDTYRSDNADTYVPANTSYLLLGSDWETSFDRTWEANGKNNPENCTAETVPEGLG